MINVRGILTRGERTQSQGSCLGLSLPLVTGKEPRLKARYKPTEPINRTLQWTLDEAQLTLVVNNPFLREEDEGVYEIFVFITGGKKLPIIIKTRARSLEEVVEQVEDCDVFYEDEQTWYEVSEDTNTVFKCDLTFEKSAGWSGKLPWTVFMNSPLTHSREEYDVVLAKDRSLQPVTYGDSKEVIIGALDSYQRYSGSRYQKIQEDYIEQTSQGAFMWLPTEEAIVFRTPHGEYAEVYHDRAESLSCQRIALRRAVVNKLYQRVGRQAVSDKTSRRHKKVVRLSSTMAFAKERGWCVRGSLAWMASKSTVRKSFADAGLVLPTDATSWEAISDSLFNHKVTFPLEEVQKMVKTDSYAVAMFCQQLQGNKSRMGEQDPNYAAIGRTIIRHKS